MVVGGLRGRGTRGCGAGGWISCVMLKRDWDREVHRGGTVGEERRTWLRLLNLLEVHSTAWRMGSISLRRSKHTYWKLALRCV